ncbi:MAG: hypothetical protein IJ150_07615 [Bacteroidales bacterium]|nr:hypothetical protein [Bacteroidales bacterium]
MGKRRNNFSSRNACGSMLAAQCLRLNACGSVICGSKHKILIINIVVLF